MFKADVPEAKLVLTTTLDALLAWTATRGREGADLRTAVGDVRAYADILLRYDLIDYSLINCFDLAGKAGINLMQAEQVRRVAAAQSAESVGAIMTKDTLIQLSLALEGDIIAATKFISREDVAKTKDLINIAFDSMEETVADEMDAIMYRSVVQLHAAIVMHLYETARPLPQMVNFRFMLPLPTLVMAHRLYADAGRADELRDENKIVHPTFMRQFGRALSR